MEWKRLPKPKRCKVVQVHFWGMWTQKLLVLRNLMEVTRFLRRPQSLPNFLSFQLTPPNLCCGFRVLIPRPKCNYRFLFAKNLIYYDTLFPRRMHHAATHAHECSTALLQIQRLSHWLYTKLQIPEWGNRSVRPLRGWAMGDRGGGMGTLAFVWT